MLELICRIECGWEDRSSAHAQDLVARTIAARMSELHLTLYIQETAFRSIKFTREIVVFFVGDNCGSPLLCQSKFAAPNVCERSDRERLHRTVSFEQLSPPRLQFRAPFNIVLIIILSTKTLC